MASTAPKDDGLSIPSTLETDRLILKRLNDPSDPQQIAWFHKIWSDEACTLWSMSGRSTSLEDSKKKMASQLETFDGIKYAVFAKSAASSQTSSTLSDGGEEEEVLLGNIGLRRLPKPTMPPFAQLPSDSKNEGREKGVEDEKEVSNENLFVRSLGYAYFTHTWGKGYATEAGRCVLDMYIAAVKSFRSSSSSSATPAATSPAQNEGTEKMFWIEAGWDQDNPASGNVMKKLGLKEVGWYVEDTDELTFIGGKWRGPGYWIWGMWV